MNIPSSQTFRERRPAHPFRVPLDEHGPKRAVGAPELKRFDHAVIRPGGDREAGANPICGLVVARCHTARLHPQVPRQGAAPFEPHIVAAFHAIHRAVRGVPSFLEVRNEGPPIQR